MIKYLLQLIFTVLGLNVFGQIAYEQGYFINDDGKRVECLIKNKEWKNNPLEFDYKMGKDGGSKTATINFIREFGIYDASKYLRATVEIDRSSKILDKISTQRAPIFKEEQLFLKVVIEGKANLYSYYDRTLNRYFYRVEKTSIKQLVYKQYQRGDIVKVNNHFRQQLLNENDLS